MDALSEALQGLRVSGSMFIDAELKAPWAVTTPSATDIAAVLGVGTDRVIPYHLVAGGDCTVQVPGEPPRALAAGDIAVFPHGDVHLLASDPAIPPMAMSREFVEQVLVRRSVLPVRFGGEGVSTRLLCGFFALDRWGGEHLVKGLPPLLTARIGTQNGRELLAAVARRTIETRAAGGPGADALVCKLTEMMFVDALREIIVGGDIAMSGWLAGLRDPAIRRALALLHARPGEAWDVNSLASACALSRSAFAARFTELVGSSPIKYLARWRLILAARDLSNSDASVMQVADRYRYGSEAAFSRAFRSAFDMPPAAYRRTRREPAPSPAGG